MTFSPLLILCIALSLVATAAIWIALWKSTEPVWFKIIGSLISAIPFIGPVLYYFFKMPPPLPVHLRATMNHFGQGGRFIGFGSKRFNYDPVDDQTVSVKTEKLQNVQARQRRAITRWEKTALVIALVFLGIYWSKAICFAMAGNPFGHANYWGQPVGTLLLLSVLVAGTAATVIVTWRYWISSYFATGKKHTEQKKRPETERRKRQSD